jgi:hypothetical protein
MLKRGITLECRMFIIQNIKNFGRKGNSQVIRKVKRKSLKAMKGMINCEKTLIKLFETEKK